MEKKTVKQTLSKRLPKADNVRFFGHQIFRELRHEFKQDHHCDQQRDDYDKDHHDHHIKLLVNCDR